MIAFDIDVELERVAWEVLQSKPFQRLRRVKQLGFSELVYPGATHTRFAHSLGVFHTARRLMKVVRRKLARNQRTREDIALMAALVHDIGHGPFSHAFEEVGKRLGLTFAGHEEMSGMLIRDGEVANILNEITSGFADDVADMVKGEGKPTVHNAVVASQFDADRLDYMRRDSMMTGVQHSVIELGWLLANLEIENVPIMTDGASAGEIPTFVIGPKAIHAAEAYVLSLFHLYQTVYFHKTVRGAEKLFTELLVQVVKLVQDGSTAQTGLPVNHPLVKFAESPEGVEAALALDDSVIWGALALLKDSKDPLLSDFSDRLLNRKLFKCFDVRAAVAHEIDPKNERDPRNIDKMDKCCASVLDKLQEWNGKKKGVIPRLLVDEASRDPYKATENTKGPTERINVRTDGNELLDLGRSSEVVGALQPFHLARVYYARGDGNAYAKIKTIIDEEVNQCRHS